MNIQFGSGAVLAIPNAGNLAVNPTPQEIGILQDFEIGFDGDLKELHGQFQYAMVSARAKCKCTGKGKLALLDQNMLNQLYFGQASSAGVNRMAYRESHTPGATVQVTNHTGFSTDYGVINADTGLNMVNSGTTAPAVGQYKVDPATGTYTFNVAETASKALITYTYADVAKGSTITLSNQLMGYAPVSQLFLYNNFRNEYFGAEMYAGTMGKVNLASKQEDFWILDTTWTFTANAAGILGKLYGDS